MRRAAILLCVLGLGGCDAVADMRAKAAAEDLVRHDMRDPKATEFRAEKIRHRKDEIAVCGEVDSPNGYGGMVGFQRFIVISAPGHQSQKIIDDASPSYGQLFSGSCPAH